MRFRTVATLLGMILASVLLTAAPASAEHLQLRFRNTRATPIADSSVVSMFTGARDTSYLPIALQNLPSNVVADLDSAAGIGIGGHVKNSLAVIAEVTGAINADCDSLYLAYDYSEDGGTRWYLGKDFVATAANNTSSATFIWLLPGNASDPNTWIWHDKIRFRLGGPGTGTSVGLQTRVTFQYRTQ